MKLGILREVGPEIKNGESYEKLLDRLVNQWASSIDMVIWLEAPVATLRERIHKRNKWHEVKDKSKEEGYKFLACHRRSFEEIIARLVAKSGIKVFHFDTEQESLKQIVETIVAEFDQERSQG
jgi:deoxyadenosine/deoxycytidine kinase